MCDRSAGTHAEDNDATEERKGGAGVALKTLKSKKKGQDAVGRTKGSGNTTSEVSYKAGEKKERKTFCTRGKSGTRRGTRGKRFYGD